MRGLIAVAVVVGAQVVEVGAVPLPVSALGVAAAVDLIPDDGGTGANAVAVGVTETVVTKQPTCAMVAANTLRAADVRPQGQDGVAADAVLAETAAARISAWRHEIPTPDGAAWPSVVVTSVRGVAKMAARLKTAISTHILVNSGAVGQTSPVSPIKRRTALGSA